MILDMIILLLGFVVILKASDVLVEAASSIALKLKIPKMLIALTIVSFGTSAPEIAISFQSLSQGNGVIGFANVIGSCVINILLIIGLASFLRPIKVKHATIKKELPLLTLVTSVFSVLMLDSVFNPFTKDTFSKADALVLLLLFGIFLFYLICMLFHKEKQGDTSNTTSIKYSPFVVCLLLILSIIFIVISSDVIVKQAEKLAYAFHISEKIITMLVIVVGTSLPEIVMTVTSARKGEFDMAIGNIVGTNIFNICIVLGLPILFYGDVLLTGFGLIDIGMVLLSSFLLFVFARSERIISKKEGFIMLLLFIIYYTWLLC